MLVQGPVADVVQPRKLPPASHNEASTMQGDRRWVRALSQPHKGTATNCIGPT